jgi:hypothetical protein
LTEIKEAMSCIFDGIPEELLTVFKSVLLKATKSEEKMLEKCEFLASLTTSEKIETIEAYLKAIISL